LLVGRLGLRRAVLPVLAYVPEANSIGRQQQIRYYRRVEQIHLDERSPLSNASFYL
jgi:hypothetical protein